MNQQIRTVAIALNQSIKQSNEYQNYVKSYTCIQKSHELIMLEERIKTLQKQIVNASLYQALELEQIKTEYHRLKDEYDQHPLVCNYHEDLLDLNELLQYINSYLNSALK